MGSVSRPGRRPIGLAGAFIWLMWTGSGCQDVAHSHHSFLLTLAVGDSCVALQLLDADLLADHIIAAGDGDGNGLWKNSLQRRRQ